ncbi:MAG: DNA-formamidopyrimidine glycosylase family protein [Myxococcota bacterium]|nr:DNA-formamidopyrimidine glycosylase family protein [Myxococcota bacterium]
MPELPEVEIMARNLRTWASGLRLEQVNLVDPKLLRGAESVEELHGRSLDSVLRRGKYVVARFGDDSLVFHFRMTGKLVLLDPDEQRSLRASLHFAGGSHVGFQDTRRFGTIDLLPNSELDPWFEQRLGPEPWPADRDGTWWAKRMARSRSPLKPVLLDQRRVAGLGNIAGSEICWRAQLDPRAPASQLSTRDWTAVNAACRAWIEDTLEVESGAEILYIGEGGGRNHNPFCVYQREGSPCPRCGAPIERLRQAGRSTFFCPPCQRMP